MVVEVTFSGTEDEFIAHLKTAFQDPAGIMAVIGEQLVSDSRLAFQNEEFGGEKWPERYPNQSDPPLNIAGALSDLSKSNTVKERRFQRRPVLFDTGTLSGSVSWEPVGKDAVQVGTTVQYASVHQFGGISVQPITEDTKDRIEAWLETPKGKPYEEKMAFLLDEDELPTDVNQRQFLGITTERRAWIRKTVEDWAAKEVTGGS